MTLAQESHLEGYTEALDNIESYIKNMEPGPEGNGQLELVLEGISAKRRWWRERYEERRHYSYP